VPSGRAADVASGAGMAVSPIVQGAILRAVYRQRGRRDIQGEAGSP
jgi:hypothetical protein